MTNSILAAFRFSPKDTPLPGFKKISIKYHHSLYTLHAQAGLIFIKKKKKKKKIIVRQRINYKLLYSIIKLYLGIYNTNT